MSVTELIVTMTLTTLLTPQSTDTFVKALHFKHIILNHRGDPSASMTLNTHFCTFCY